MASIGDENASCAPGQSQRSTAMPLRQRFKLSSCTFEFRLAQEVISLRKQAEGMPHGIRRDELLRKAGQVDAASQVNKWLTSPGMRAPT
jgi:hypothetical protein